jgi:magnesium chelatase subunit D
MIFPFSAVIGQENIKNALIWNFINPRIGGVLISGQKGTAKSTLVRASEEISGRKIVELPLNITEDRLIGGIDFETTIKSGNKKLLKGLLAEADGNILYADEINLLSENISKVLLDSDGIYHVEREGISDSFDSRFILIGSMNPEEGMLRPQLLDRFGLYVDVVGEESLALRCEIIRRRMEFEKNPEKYIASYEEENRQIKQKIDAARKRLPDISVSDNAYAFAARLAADSGCAGSRGEIAIIETARAICSYRGYPDVNREAITEASKFALPHRIREKQESFNDSLNDNLNENMHDTPHDENNGSKSETDGSSSDNGGNSSSSENSGYNGENMGDSRPDYSGKTEEKTDKCGEEYEVCNWLKNDNTRLVVTKGNGRRSLVRTNLVQGRYVKSRIGNGSDIAFDSTIRAAAPHQKNRDKNGMALAVRPCDIRVKVREKRTGNLIVFVVDASGSMGAGKRMEAVKGAILSLLGDAYRKRDRVAMITFRRDSAELILGVTRSVELAAKKLEMISTGGKTPVYAGLESARLFISSLKIKEKELMPVIVLVSDGRATCGKSKNPFKDAEKEAKAIADAKIKSVVIDVEQDFIKLGLAGKLAESMNADIYRINELCSDAVLSAVKSSVF